MIQYQSVKLIAATQPLLQIEEPGVMLMSDPPKPKLRQMTADEFVSYTARVSNPGNQMNTATAPKLIGYLIKHKHWSPFEMAHAVQEIKTTRDIGRQILRHRSFSFQEYSQRYALASDILSWREARLQDKKNRQNSIETDDEALTMEWENICLQTGQDAIARYERAIEMGVAKEQARAILPEGLTMSTILMGGTLRSWIHYCEERMKEGVQKEHREIAVQAWANICHHFPSIKEHYAAMLDAEEAAKWAGGGRG